MKYSSKNLPRVPESKGKNVDDKLLCCAWCLNLPVREEIHRFELFGFFQTYIGNEIEQTLQRVIEKSAYWDYEKGTGVYTLNEKGESRIKNTFGNPKYKINRKHVYIISRTINEETFSIKLNGKSKKTTVYINEKSVKGPEARSRLKSLTNFERKTTGVSYVWNWILQGEYFWESEMIDQTSGEIEKSNDSILRQVKEQQTPSQDKQNYWIFQSDPDIYEIETDIKLFDTIDYPIPSRKNDYTIGDYVFLWMSGKQSGIIALAKIISLPEVTNPSPEGMEHAIGKAYFAGEQLRVKIKIEEILKSPVKRADLLNHPILSNLSVIRTPLGTVFSLTKEQGDELMKMVTEQQPDSSREEEEEEIVKPIIYTFEELLIDLGVDESVINGWLDALNRKKQVIFYGPPGTGKTYTARNIAKYIASQKHGIVELVQFHPSYAYEDFIQGIRPVTRNDGSLEYKIEKGRLLKFCDKAKSHDGISVLIIDEINRAELSRVFGELMYLLEYRNETITLASGEFFSFPKNVYVIGTMNTADRSIALVDHALRRRFAFLRLFPEYTLLEKYHKTTGFNPKGLIDLLKKVNHDIGDMNYYVGVSFFMHPDLKTHIKSIWQMEIEPYLEEYFFDDQDRVDIFRWGNVSDQILG